MQIACFHFPQIGIGIERARLPHLWGAPLGLTSDDGTLLRISEEARAAGVQIGQPAPGARLFCPTLVTLPYDRNAYNEAARALWDALAVESSVVEPCSPEICYVEMEGRHAAERVRRLAAELTASMHQEIGVGMASAKLTARLAALRDPGGNPKILPAGREPDLLRDVPWEQITDLDAPLRKRLQKLGLHTPGDLRKLPAGELYRQLGAMALRLERLACGKDSDPVRPLWPPPGMESAMNFEWEVNQLATVEKALEALSAEVAQNLLKERAFCRTLLLCLTLTDSCRMEVSEKLAEPADRAADIYRGALRLLGRLRPHLDRPVTGVSLRAGELGIPQGVQLDLLDLYGNTMPHLRRRKLDAALAFLRGRYGVGAVLSAGMLAQGRRIHLWTYPLGHLLNEPVSMITTTEGVPAQFWRRNRCYQVRRILQDWCETEWVWDARIETVTYRLETEPSGIFELHEVEGKWRITASAD